jgi:AP2-associated kinase
MLSGHGVLRKGSGQCSGEQRRCLLRGETDPSHVPRYAMHCQSPPIAHRDRKAEIVLMGADGVWKLCDFGSTSTNHKRFERPEEMGIEEDIIRKHTTPAYRAPEMWDLYRRELISEKVDIWALGCLLYRMAYLKSAFDGKSKLQILNGNHRIPELP